MANGLKVMIVEDDATIASAVKTIIKSNFPCERIITAADGLEAWQLIREGNYDLILSDWNMPQMSGKELLEKVRGEARTSRIRFLMLTARRDVESITAAVKAGVTDYVIKPFDKTALIQKIENLTGGKAARQAPQQKKPDVAATALDRKSISIKIMELIGKGEVTLPAMPQIIFSIEEMMKREDADIADLAKLIGMDPGISSKLIGIANSVYYRGIKECTQIEEAIMRLGMKETRQLVYLISNRNLFSLKDARFEGMIKDLYIHAVACGAASQSLARHLNIPDLNNFFALGLLHDVGKLLVLQVLSELTKEQRDVDAAPAMDIVNSLHNKAGYMLLSRWSFPEIYLSTALLHQDVSVVDKPEQELLIVNLANLFVRELGYSLRKEREKDLLQCRSAQTLRVTAAVFEKSAEEVRAQVEKMTAIL